MTGIGSLDDLEAALAEEIRLERELAVAGLLRRDALVDLDAEAVEHAAAREQNLLAALAGAAERRLRRTSESARLLAVPGAETSLTRVAAEAAEPSRSRLRGLVAELREAFQDLGRVNDANRALTGQALDHVKHSFRILAVAREPGIYSPRGLQPRPEQSRLMFDEVV